MNVTNSIEILESICLFIVGSYILGMETVRIPESLSLKPCSEHVGKAGLTLAGGVLKG